MRSTQAVAVCLTAVISLLCGCGPGTKAPFNLSYTVPSAVYAKDVAIAANNPASSGGAATSYAVTPSLPAGMSFSLSSGVISGTPTAVSGAANYRVIAANSAGNTQTTLNISVNPSPLNASNLNLIFVVSGDLAYPGSGDINPVTANLTDQGLRRSLVMATYLQNQVLGGKNVTAIYAVEPMTHLQTTNDYPDVAAMGSIQQFAMLNQATVSSDANGGTPLAAGSFPLNVSYSTGPPPPGVVTPLVPCQACQGFDFNDEGRDNEALLTSIIKTNSPGFHVFSAPWEIVSSLLANISSIEGYNLPVPAGYTGPNDVYAISITPSGTATLATYNSNLNPSASYPVLPSTVVSNGCPAQTSPFKIAVTVGANGAIAPPGINKNETFYMVRHAEAHPTAYWDDGNYIAKGQWRALDLPNALKGKISPDQVLSIDPAQAGPGSYDASGNHHWSYVRPLLTVEPYAIANGLPFNLAASFPLLLQNAPQLATQASAYFFNGGQFSNQKVLLAWEHDHIPTTVNALLTSYFQNGGGQPASLTAPNWPDADYDTVWTVTIDGAGNVTVDNATCEGIDSGALPSAAPQF